MTRSIALVIGDVMLDRRSDGEMRTISPEAPVPVVRQTSLTESLGGAGNVARNIKALGHDVLLLGAVGADPHGAKVLSLAVDNGITACLVTGSQPTIVKERVTCNGYLVSRLDIEAPGVDPAVTQQLINGLHSIPPEQQINIKVIVVADYAKGTMTMELMAVLRQLSAAYRIPIFVDARPSVASLYYAVTLLKPNLAEAVQMLDSNVHPGLAASLPRSVVAGVACQELRRVYQANTVVVTAGPDGCSYTDPDDQFRVHEMSAVGPAGDGQIRDVCGAGDTVMAALAVGAIEGRGLSQSVLFAMHAAAYVVGRAGIVVPPRDAVDQLIYERGGWSHKIMTMDDCIRFIARQRRLNPQVSVVLANGCFDGFHAGHLETLRFAKQHGDTVVVAYNDDTSLQKLKGVGRPHVPDSYRASHLALQACVSVVVRFDGDAARLVQQLKPDVLVKGEDAKSKKVPGADFLASHGGRVEFCPFDAFSIMINRALRTKANPLIEL